MRPDAGDRATPAQRQYDFYRAAWIDARPADADPDAEARADVENFLTGVAALTASRDWNAYPRPDAFRRVPELAAEAAALLNDGCDDPLVLALQPWLAKPTRDNGDAALDDVEEMEGAYPPVALLAARHAIITVTWRLGEQGEAWTAERNAAWGRDLGGVLANAAAGGAWDEAWDRPVLLMAELRLDNTADASPEWLDALPEAARQGWLARCVAARILIEAAWQARGSGYASTVTDDGWEQFHGNLAAAEELLRGAWLIRQDRPEPAAMMVTALRGEDGSADWFDRAATADPADTRAYSAMENFTRPRWGGSPELQFDLARRALRDERWDTPVPDVVDRVLDDVIEDDGEWLRANADDVWPVLRRYFDGRADRPLGDRTADWTASRGFGTAALLGLDAEARGFLRRVDGDASRLVQLSATGGDRRWTVGAVALSEFPFAADAVARSEFLANGGEFDAAAAQLREVLPRVEAASARQHLTDRLRVIEWRKAYAAGEWVDLLEHGLEGWRPSRGRWEAGGGPGVVGTADAADGGLRASPNLPLGDRFEVELEMELPDGWRGRPWGGAGLLFGTRPEMPTHLHNFSFIDRDGEVWLWGAGDGKYTYFGKDVGPTVELRVALDGRVLTVEVADPAARQVYTLEDDPPNDLLAIGGWFYSVGGSPVRFATLRVRRMPDAPAPE